MPVPITVSSVPGMYHDSRVRVFRRHFSVPGEFDDMQVDTYAVISERYLIICDTALCPEDMATVMEELRGEPAGRQLLVFNSHADWDHTWGNACFTGEHVAPIIGHEECRERLLSDEARTELEDFKQRYTLFQNVVLTPPTLTFTSAFNIYGGDLTLEIFHAPGHCPDHCAIWIPQLRLLLAFDAVEWPLPGLRDANSFPMMIATLERFKALQPLHVLCSHGQTTRPQLIDENLAYLHSIEQRARALLLTHRPTPGELEQPSALINYPFDEAIAGTASSGAAIDRTYYGYAHDSNIRSIIQWLLNKMS
ncbi:MAG TPA: MBL fold metallo-hydrolase [Ktedonobacteraceae bacterium]|nr:MBL fold metallo-hydrolase [Ktedonobacteraceae bacterium]